MTEAPDIEIARYALRTFALADAYFCDLDDDQIPFSWRVLTGMYRASGDWLTGECLARCEKGYAHEVPAAECECGIYGALCLASLRKQYPQASRLVAVIAAQYKTIIGSQGLRTSGARVVAYWCRPDAKAERHQCATQFREAREYYDLTAMLSAYEIPV
ncbi:hypothetical protein [Mycobacterium colombiense]|uniref:hypothetical protein n=1 Tax=Mycobacterium colombiense TaxID=339268 RepID=UPI0007ED3390|nr:hypothetical protein [Mycobacterium colombiense]OBJ26869.1 hypothetical protein A5620_05455 [Mycobacterium colombiense]